MLKCGCLGAMCKFGGWCSNAACGYRHPVKVRSIFSLLELHGSNTWVVDTIFSLACTARRARNQTARTRIVQQRYPLSVRPNVPRWTLPSFAGWRIKRRGVEGQKKGTIWRRVWIETEEEENQTSCTCPYNAWSCCVLLYMWTVRVVMWINEIRHRFTQSVNQYTRKTQEGLIYWNYSGVSVWLIAQPPIVVHGVSRKTIRVGFYLRRGHWTFPLFWIKMFVGPWKVQLYG